jgi:geranylgeranyl diphosphate synthase type I
MIHKKVKNMETSVDLKELRSAVENELKQVIDQSIPDEYIGMRPLLTYHMGWEGEGAGPEAQGKRIRPLLVLLCTIAAGGEWRPALPSAAAVELIHNFSLIHDDIQDQSPLRHGRKTVWNQWGVAQAINAGDLMFTLAFVALQGLRKSFSSDTVLDATQILQATCVKLTGGQHLDLSYEQIRSLPLDAYWPMIAGKTAALLSACAELGALTAGATLDRRRDFQTFGYKLGLAFQVQDDWLGIWGDAAKVGKSTVSDLVSGKKSLPVVYGLQQHGRFSHRWLQGSIAPEEVLGLAKILEEEGARTFVQENADHLTQEALQALERAVTVLEGKQLLYQMAERLLRRDY